MGLAGALAIHFKPLSPPKVKKEKGSSLLLTHGYQLVYIIAFSLPNFTPLS